MERLWAPWRLEYIKSADEEPGCIFCTRLARSDDEQDLILFRGQRSFIILNAFPYTNGHLMIVPNEHVAEIEGVADEGTLVFRLMTLDPSGNPLDDQVEVRHG